MKKALVAVLLTLFVSSWALASGPESTQRSNVNWEKAEKNYLVALASENIGVRKSAANYLAAYRLTGAVKPLIDVLQTDRVELLRMAAAHALVQLGNKEGMEAVKEATRFDGSVKVAAYCEKLLQSASEELSLK